MTIYFKKERDLRLDTQEIYDILDFAIQAADDDGFVSEYVYERAIYVYAICTLMPEYAEEVSNLITIKNPLEAWHYCCTEELIDKLVEDYSEEIEFLAEQGKIWLENYLDYAHSARGLLSTIQSFSSDIVAQTVEKFKEANNGSDIQQVLSIAENWGMNSGFDAEEIRKENIKTKPAELISLYDKELI